ncbi:ABC transporter permease [Gordonia sp. KTR9]|uniref:ABC transporter permease n=1 Tax=Gordonia sp. KTR9 TaxID=337191 RepID=UPI00027DD8C0|nr:ABC transporter permease [Gordonia sp. KTR9]AFR47901.1 Ribose/xylose/arabinose/galactoside ABC-type transport systems, permease component [Gordonia sp. KTR9]
MTTIEHTPDVSATVPGIPRKRPTMQWFGDTGGVLVAFGLLILVAAVSQPSFFTWSNLMNIVGANSVALALALGSTFVIIAGGIDLSVVSMSAAAGMGFGLLLQAGAPAVICVVGALACGAVLGIINGILVARAKISFLVVTLGMASIAASIALLADDGATINVFDVPAFGAISTFATGQVGSIPIILVFDVVLVLLAAGVLGYTRFGRSVFAVGSNADAARLNGINVRNIKTGVYALAGLSAGVAAIVQVGRLTGASPQIDPALLNGVLAAVLIGGTSFTGGKGSIWGTVIGVLFLGVVQNAMTLADISSFWRQAVNGVLLIAAVGLGVVRTSGGFDKVVRVLTPRREAMPHG